MAGRLVVRERGQDIARKVIVIIIIREFEIRRKTHMVHGSVGRRALKVEGLDTKNGSQSFDPFGQRACVEQTGDDMSGERQLCVGNRPTRLCRSWVEAVLFCLPAIKPAPSLGSHPHSHVAPNSILLLSLH